LRPLGSAYCAKLGKVRNTRRPVRGRAALAALVIGIGIIELLALII